MRGRAQPEVLHLHHVITIILVSFSQIALICDQSFFVTGCPYGPELLAYPRMGLRHDCYASLKVTLGLLSEASLYMRLVVALLGVLLIVRLLVSRVFWAVVYRPCMCVK